MKQVTIRYYSQKLFLTIDLNLLFERLAAEWPDVPEVVVGEMTSDEKALAASKGHGIMFVHDRIHIYAPGSDGQRMQQLEKEIERASP